MTVGLRNADEVLQRVFGFSALRPAQADVVSAVLEGADVLAVMPTGAGKSLCYQLPALVGGSLTVVVSPLIALMRDQVARLRARGVAAGALHSGGDAADAYAIERALADRQLRLLYVSPERLARSGMTARLRSAGCDRLAIDEAHCVAQWGHDFRPDYLGLHDAAEALGRPPIIAVTASADQATRDEIVARLFDRPPRCFVHSFDRPNLYLSAALKTHPTAQIVDFVRARSGQSGIVYASSRNGVEALARLLSERGVPALAYHAGMEHAHRNAHQDEFLQRTGITIVATTAFGMGIDKADVRFVCHANLPSSIEGYYQEIGRAGRDGARADTLLVWSEGDARVRERQITQADAPPERRAAERRRLATLLAFCESPRCRRQTLLAAFGEKAGPCGFCDVCAGDRPLVDGVLAAQKAMSALLRTSGRFHPGHLANLLIGKATEAVNRHNHHVLPTFGVGRDRTAAGWRSVFRQLHAAELIVAPDGDEGWSLTEAGRAVLTGKAAIKLLAEGGGSPGRAATRARSASGEAEPEALTTADERLFARLRARRLQLAQHERVPAYVICPDRALRALAVHRPVNKTCMADVPGFGAKRVATYGDAFLAVIGDDAV